MSDFQYFAAAVEEKLDAMSKYELFVVDVENIFDRYLAAFPEGTNPVYRERTEHDCSCCKHFVRNVGNVVAIIDGKTTSIWDLDGLPEPYATVAQRMADLTLKLDILKHVIAAKIAENEARKVSAEKAEKRRKLLDALAAKEDAELGAKTKEDILKELAALDA